MKKFIFMIAMILFTAVLLGTNIFEANTSSYRKVSSEEAMKIMNENQDFIIIDVRSKEEYDKEHIKNAISLPFSEIEKEKLEILPNKEQLILVYCKSGRRSKQASKELIKQGYSNVIDFGGIIDWKGETVK